MKFTSKLKFITGMVSVVLLVGVLILYLNNSLSTIDTPKANLRAETITIGTDYAGLIVKNHVEEGATITKGQKLFEIQSQQLIEEMASPQFKASSLPFKIDPTTNNIIIEARDDGIVQEIFYLAGAYVPKSGILANVNTPDSLYVEAHFNLTPPNYARLKKGADMRVTFPDNSKTDAQIYNISLENKDNVVDTVIKARIVNANLSDFKFNVGTPVEATVKLADKTWYQSLVESARNLFKPAER